MSELRDLLRGGTARPVVELARELNGRARLPDLAELSADASLSPRLRVVALLAVGLRLAAEPEALLPELVLDAIDDVNTITAALEMRLGGALTGVLAAAPHDDSLRATRRILGRRMLAAGENGPHVVQLLRDAGDSERAAVAAADDLAAHLEGTPESLELLLRLHVTLEWARDAEFFVAILHRLRPDDLVRLSDLLIQCPGLATGLVSAVRTAIGLALTPGTQRPTRR